MVAPAVRILAGRATLLRPVGSAALLPLGRADFDAPTSQTPDSLPGRSSVRSYRPERTTFKNKTLNETSTVTDG